MPETTKTILDRIRRFHRQLADLYEGMSHIADKERVKILLEYLSRHEEHLESCLDKYEKGAAKRILHTCFQAISERGGGGCLKEVQVHAGMSLQEVVDMALHFDDCLIKLYQELADHAPSEEVRSLFRDLMRLEERDEHQLVRDAFELEDV